MSRSGSGRGSHRPQAATGFNYSNIMYLIVGLMYVMVIGLLIYMFINRSKRREKRDAASKKEKNLELQIKLLEEQAMLLKEQEANLKKKKGRGEDGEILGEEDNGEGVEEELAEVKDYDDETNSEQEGTESSQKKETDNGSGKDLKTKRSGSVKGAEYVDPTKENIDMIMRDPKPCEEKKKD